VNLYHSFGHAVLSWPDRPAIFFGKRPHATFAQLDDRARRLAGGLARLGLERGDRVAIVMGNRPEYTEIMLATWAAGLCLVPINAKLHEREFAYVLDNCGAKACFTSAELVEALSRCARGTGGQCEIVDVDGPDYRRLFTSDPIEVVDVSPEELGWLFYTSGTTGRPKGAMLSHRNLWLMTLSYVIDAGPFDTQTRTLMVAPQSHASGLLLMAYMTRGGAAVVPESGGFDPAEMIPLINHFGSASFFAAPTMVKRFVEAPEIGSLDVSKLDTIVYGGGPMYVADTRRALDVLGPRLWQIYGQGETPCTITYLSKEKHGESDHPRFLDRLASVGLQRTGVQMRVVDEALRPVPPGEVGEIIVRGDTVMSGYWNNPEASAQSLRDGWLLTGDLGFLDVDGYLTLKDRSKDLVISGGSNIYPREIEEILLTHPGVREAAVIGAPHPEWGEVPVAFIVGFPGRVPSTEELDKVCLDNIARFKRPKRYVFVDELPKNNYGKILKTELRQRLAKDSDAELGASR
jgi:acyl-CoA synthetase (AMP-forming)/AMP-acid ligase II